MNVSVGDLSTLKGWVEAGSKPHSHLEMEAVILPAATGGFALHSQTFRRSCKFLTARMGWQQQHASDQLDISTAGGMRVTIAGQSNMSVFFADPARGNSGAPLPDGVTVMRKVRVEQPVELKEYGVRCNLKREEPVEGEAANTHLRTLAELNKTYRLKKRYRYVNAAFPNVAVDMTLVKQSAKDVYYKSFGAAKVTTQAPQFEVEVELLPDGTLDAFLGALHQVLMAVDGGLPLLAETEKDIGIRDYLRRVYGDKVLLNSPGERNFAGPKPVTLELKHFLPSDSATTPTVLHDYSVTDKADGESALLWVNRDGRAMLLNDRLKARGTGIVLPPSFHGTLLHGELLLDGRSDFLAFDMYLDCNKDIRSLPLIAASGASRLACLHVFVEAVQRATAEDGFSGLKVVAKKFYAFDDDVFEAARQVLNGAKAGNYDYTMDGLIYTPCSLPVGGVQRGIANPTWGDTWSRVFKWKPPKQNSIDFEVRFPKDGDKDIITVKGGDVYKVAHLHVGFNTTQDATYTPLAYLTNQSGVKQKKSAYVAQVFSPEDDTEGVLYEAYLPVVRKGAVVCEDGDEIHDKDVVEFAYLPHSEAHASSAMRWQPLRVRYDKVQKALRTGATTANHHNTANSVWRSICMPVTEELVTGMRPLTAEETAFATGKTVYYANLESRSNSATIRLRNFHSFVKRRMLFEPLQGRRSILDLGCGEGGDLDKIMKAGFIDMVGLDLYEENIINPAKGAYSRLIKANRRAGNRINNMRYVYVPYDVSQGIDAVHINKTEDAGNRVVLQTLWGVIPKQMIKPKSLMGYYGLAAGGFEAVSCQFAMHYFCESAQTFDRFAQTVSRNLKPGGRFVATCMDGERVSTMLKRMDLNVGDAVTRTAGGRTLWSIVRRYETEFDQDAGTMRAFGKGIDVYLESIGTTNREYLVDYSVVKKVFAKYDVHEVSTGLFEAAFNALKTSDGDDGKTAAIKSAEAMSEAEKEFSFLNRWFVFEKRASTSSSTPPT